MMYPLPEVVPISELRTRQKEILEKVSEEPVLITEHGRAVGVLLGPETYNQLLEQLEELRLALDAAAARADDSPAMDFEDYLAGRGERMPAATDE